MNNWVVIQNQPLLKSIYTKLPIESILETVFTIAAPAFDILFIGCVLNTKVAYTTAEKLTFEAFY